MNFVDFIKELFVAYLEIMHDFTLDIFLMLKKEQELNLIILFFGILFWVITLKVCGFIVLKISNLITCYFNPKNKDENKERKDFFDKLEKKEKINKKLQKEYPATELGILAEYKCFNQLRTIAPNMKLYKNVFLYSSKKDKTLTGECDIIGVEGNSIYFFEVKSYNGIIYPSKEEYWEHYSYGVTDYRYSPVLQTRGHVNLFHKDTNNAYNSGNYKIHKIVVFDDRTMIIMPKSSMVENMVQDTYIVNMENLAHLIGILRKDTSDIDNDDLHRYFTDHINVSDEIKNMQIANVNKHKKN